MVAKAIIIYVLVVLFTILAVSLVDELTLGKNSKYVKSLDELIAAQDELIRNQDERINAQNNYINALVEQNKWLKIKCDLCSNDRIEDDLK